MGGWGSGRKRNKGTIQWKNRFDVRTEHRKRLIQPGEKLVISGQDIKVAWTPCNYGGSRPWVLCPACGQRFAVLYQGKNRFACRQCLRLSYPIQRMDDLSAAAHRTRRLRRRLKGPCHTLHDLFLPVFEKPKGMHLKTFLHLHQRDALAGRAAFAEWVRFLHGKLKRLEIPLPPVSKELAELLEAKQCRTRRTTH